jgi:hypothetical protein
MNGSMDEWMEVNAVLRDCLVQYKNLEIKLKVDFRSRAERQKQTKFLISLQLIFIH